MIQFRDDTALPVPETGDGAGFAMIGIGAGGVNIIDQFVLENRGYRNAHVLDSDGQAIRGTVVEKSHAHLLGPSRLRGLGTGGDAELAAELARAEADALSKAFAGIRTAILVTTLGGGMGTGATPVVARLLREAGARVLVAACMPFAFEGRRRRLAESALREVFDAADVVLVFANDRVLHLPESAADIREAFRAMNGLVARAAFGLQRLLEGHGSAPLGLADLRRHAGRVALENTWTGSGAASGEDRVASVVEQIMDSPLLVHREVWQQAGTALLSVTGGADLTMTEYRELVARLREAFPVDLEIRGSAVVDAQAGRALRASLLLGLAGDRALAPAPEQEPALVAAQPVSEKPLPAEEPESEPEFETGPVAVGARVSAKKAPTPQRYFAQQEELELDSRINRGRFEKTVPTVIDGQDLDVPTFMRQGLKIKL